MFYWFFEFLLRPDLKGRGQLSNNQPLPTKLTKIEIKNPLDEIS